jgi:hypothetical protein
MSRRATRDIPNRRRADYLGRRSNRERQFALPSTMQKPRQRPARRVGGMGRAYKTSAPKAARQSIPITAGGSSNCKGEYAALLTSPQRLVSMASSGRVCVWVTSSSVRKNSTSWPRSPKVRSGRLSSVLPRRSDVRRASVHRLSAGRYRAVSGSPRRWPIFSRRRTSR